MTAENRMSYISVNRESRRNSHSAGTGQQKDFSRKSKALDERLNVLEARKMARAEKIPAAPIVDPEAEDSKWLADMEVLATGTYEEKKEVYQEREDAGLNPSEAKRQYRQQKEDDEWVDAMLAHGGQKKEGGK